MDIPTAQQIRDEIAAATPEQQKELKFLSDSIDALIERSLRLDDLLSQIVKEKDERLRGGIAENIKAMMPGLLGEDCSTVAVN